MKLRNSFALIGLCLAILLTSQTSFGYGYEVVEETGEDFSDDDFSDDDFSDDEESENTVVPILVEGVIDLNERAKLNSKYPCQSQSGKECPPGYMRSNISSSQVRGFRKAFDVLVKELGDSSRELCFSENLMNSYVSSRNAIPADVISDELLLKLVASLSSLKKGEPKRLHFVKGNRWGEIRQLPSGATRIYFFNEDAPVNIDSAKKDGTLKQIGKGKTKQAFAEFIYRDGVLTPSVILRPNPDNPQAEKEYREEIEKFVKFNRILRKSSGVSIPSVETDLDGRKVMVGELYDESMSDTLPQSPREGHTSLSDRSHSDRLKIGMGIIRGVSKLHRHNIIWNDAKADNVLLKNKNQAAVTDLGESRVLRPQKGETFNTMGDIRFVPPEVGKNAPLETKADVKRVLKRDVFGVGIMLDAMFFPETHPKTNYNITTEQKVAMRKDIKAAQAQMTDNWVEYYHAEKKALKKSKKKDPLKQLVLDCMNPDPDKRPSSRAVLRRYRNIARTRI